MSNPKIIESYLNIRAKIKEQRKILSELRNAENEIAKEIQDYLNQTEERGIRIDQTTSITLASNEKKINRNQQAYKNKLQQLVESRGYHRDSIEFVDEIMKAKIETTVQQQRLKIIKTK